MRGMSGRSKPRLRVAPSPAAAAFACVLDLDDRTRADLRVALDALRAALPAADRRLARYSFIGPDRRIAE